LGVPRSYDPRGSHHAGKEDAGGVILLVRRSKGYSRKSTKQEAPHCAALKSHHLGTGHPRQVLFTEAVGSSIPAVPVAHYSSFDFAGATNPPDWPSFTVTLSHASVRTRIDRETTTCSHVSLPAIFRPMAHNPFKRF
jgi:hypothetical protein